MFDFSKSIFDDPFSTSKVIFVEDFLLSDLIGGAELSMDALRKASPIKHYAIRSKEVSLDLMRSNLDKHWVFGNFAMLNPQLIIAAIQLGLNYSVFEHDYKVCRWRSIERHEIEGKEKCNCASSQWGILIQEFYSRAKQVWFCSNKHMERYFQLLPQMRRDNCEVLSAIFGEDFFQKIKPLIESLPSRNKKGWITLDSDSWIKGTDDAINWLKKNDKSYRLIKGMRPDDVLELMADSEGFVCLPRGADVSNRMVTEAKLLGCQVIHNENVQHAAEDWLNNPDKNFTLNWLYDRRKVFWNKTLTFCK
jgi:hypothetical protein